MATTVEDPKKQDTKTVKFVSVYHQHGITLKGTHIPKAVVDGKLVIGTRVGGQRVVFENNEADVPEPWLEYMSDTTGEMAGMKHTLGYGNDFVEKEKLIKALRSKKRGDPKNWADAFFEKMNTRRVIAGLEEVQLLDFLGMNPS